SEGGRGALVQRSCPLPARRLWRRATLSQRKGVHARLRRAMRERGKRVRGWIMTTPILQLLNVESNYGPVQALRGVSLSVTEGKIVTVLGANGAGKTTTLKTISGIIAPRKGQVKFKGADIQGGAPDAIVRAGIVHVPEGREVF